MALKTKGKKVEGESAEVGRRGMGQSA